MLAGARSFLGWQPLNSCCQYSYQLSTNIVQTPSLPTWSNLQHQQSKLHLSTVKSPKSPASAPAMPLNQHLSHVSPSHTLAADTRRCIASIRRHWPATGTGSLAANTQQAVAPAAVEVHSRWPPPRRPCTILAPDVLQHVFLALVPSPSTRPARLAVGITAPGARPGQTMPSLDWHTRHTHALRPSGQLPYSYA